MFPFIIAAAVAGGALAASSASKSNRNVKKAAKANYAILNDQIEQSRFAFYDNASRLGQAAQTNLSNYYLSIQGKTGGAYRAVASQIARDAARDAINLKENAAATEKSLELQKENIRIGAQSQVQSVPLAALQGGISGASTGASLVGAFQSLQGSQQNLNQAKQSSVNTKNWYDGNLGSLRDQFRDRAINAASANNSSYFNIFNQARNRFR